MKKSIKKYLILALVVVSIVVTSVCVASAANGVRYYCSNCKATVSTKTEYHPAGCESNGSIEYKCTLCDLTITFVEDGKAVVDKEKCISCGTCYAVCPVEAPSSEE